MREIPLTKGYVAIVDEEDYEWLSQYYWQANPRKTTNYATRAYWQDKRMHTRSMHRDILALTDPKLYVDHINRNTLDNRRCNLRIATPQENNRNKRPKEGLLYKGVRKTSCVTPWKVGISVNRKHIHLGYYKTAEEAARVYDAKVRELYGEFAYVNFPDTKPAQTVDM